MVGKRALNAGLRNLGQDTRDIALSYGVEISTDYCFVLSQCTRVSEGRTDELTDRQRDDVDSKTVRRTVKTKCFPIYGLEACPLTKTQVNSLNLPF